MKYWMTLMALIAPLSAHSMIISFDDDAGVQTGLVSYDGAGGPLVGESLTLFSVVGTGTPLNDGTVLECRGCLLDFSTGGNISEGTPDLFGPGGILQLFGSVYDGITLIADGLLASGSFTSISTATVLGNTGVFTGIGLDQKNPDLAGYYGLGNQFEFANTAISLSNCAGDAFGGFSCGATNVDFDNTAVVSAPNSLGLMGAGLLGAGWVSRKKKKGRGK